MNGAEIKLVQSPFVIKVTKQREGLGSSYKIFLSFFFKIFSHRVYALCTALVAFPLQPTMCF